MCKCNYPGCGETFASHTALTEHIFRDHAARMFAAIIAALIIALALLRPVSAQDAPAPQPTPTVGGGPQIAVEHKVFLPFVVNDNGVKAAASWCPSFRVTYQPRNDAICLLAGDDRWLVGRLDHAGLVFAQK